MRSNPRYNNTCSIRIGMYRESACYDCSKLSECDQHYDEITGEWDYPAKGTIMNLGAHRLPPTLMQAVGPEAGEEIKRRNRQGRKSKGGQLSSAEHRKNQYLVKTGKAKPVEYTLTVQEAIKAAGLS